MSRHSIRLANQDIEQPGHICAFFSSRAQEYETVLPYLRDGLDAGERVINVLDASRLDDHRRRLTAAGLPLDDGLSLASAEDTYLADGRFDMERMIAFVRDALAEAEREGKRLRTCGWMDWIHRDLPGTERTMEYEARMNLLAPDHDCTFMCVYDLDRLAGETIADIMATHPFAIVGGEVRRNPFYVPPEVYLSEVLGRRPGA
jgi:hypothetical protein